MVDPEEALLLVVERRQVFWEVREFEGQFATRSEHVVFENVG